MQWHPEAYQKLLDKQYDWTIHFYEKAIEVRPHEILSYWLLGLAHLIAGNEELAQTSWLLGLTQIEEDQVGGIEESSLSQLSKILAAEINQQKKIGNSETAWIISRHLREIAPDDLRNLYQLVLLSIDIELYEPSFLEEINLAQVILSNSPTVLCENEIFVFLSKIFDYPSHHAIEVCKAFIQAYEIKAQWVNNLAQIAVKVGDSLDSPLIAADLLELCLEITPNNVDILCALCGFSTNANRFERAIEVARLYSDLSKSLSDQFLSNYQLLRALTRSGFWLEAFSIATKSKKLLSEICLTPQIALKPEVTPFIVTSAGLFAYLQDDIVENRDFHNKIGRLFTQNKKKKILVNRIHQTSGKLKLGYIGSTLRAHSVGWLSRWIFKYHNREKFHISTYLINQVPGDLFYDRWFREQVDESNFTSLEPMEIAKKIHEDNIDILIDLDSITLNVTYEVMAMKPAPIQVTWLGWDAPGLSTVDYFIADPYVLGEEAQKYYQEKIWRLPHTYVAVDGFEIGTPSFTRSGLQIPNDAVVFFSSQSGSKRHPETIRLQMQIIKGVPGSYFLIKAIGDVNAVKTIFVQLAEQEGVSLNRLRFMEFVDSEFTHRANLQLVDIVLDTYPYNGATTTLETLWTGIPLVTKVGNIFSSRNSYSFMVNAGLSEGIAWTDSEYIDWGIRLGRDAVLRQQVSTRLQLSRRTSPLWNTQAFAVDMENAYQQMWQRYLNIQ